MRQGSTEWRAPGQATYPHRNVSEMERYVSAAAAAGLALWAMRQRSGASWLLAGASAVLGYRAVTGHCPAYAAAGISTARGGDTRDALSGSRGVHAEASVIVNRHAEDLFAWWRNLENLPQVMSHLVSVRDLGGGRSRWRSKGPMGSVVEWDAEINNEVPNQLIGWRSLEGSTIVTAGSVNFDRLQGSPATRVRVKLQYDPPGGKLGAWVAWLFGEEPNIQIEEDLQKFKTAMEGGQASSETLQATGRDTSPGL